MTKYRHSDNLHGLNSWLRDKQNKLPFLFNELSTIPSHLTQMPQSTRNVLMKYRNEQCITIEGSVLLFIKDGKNLNTNDLSNLKHSFHYTETGRII